MAIFCPNNTPDHNPAILSQIRTDRFEIDHDYYYSGADEMDYLADSYTEDIHYL